MVADDRRDLGIGVDVGEDALADLRVPLHLTPLLEGERAWLLEQAGRQADLADVVDEAAEVGELLLLDIHPEALGDVAGVDRDGGRVARGVPVSGVERRDERRCEREVRALELRVRR